MEGSKELEKNSKKFYESLSKCPICGDKMIACNDVLVKKVKDSTMLMTCSNCEILIGRYT